MFINDHTSLTFHHSLTFTANLLCAESASIENFNQKIRMKKDSYLKKDLSKSIISESDSTLLYKLKEGPSECERNKYIKPISFNNEVGVFNEINILPYLVDDEGHSVIDACVDSREIFSYINDILHFLKEPEFDNSDLITQKLE